MSRARESESRGPAWLVQAALIARWHYLEGRSKVEIADRLGLSRFKVARILDEARELGLVEVSIRLPAHIDADLSTAVREEFGLHRAIVVEHPGADPGRARNDLGHVAADLLTELVGAKDVLGLTCSRTVAATTQALHALAGCRVVQLTGTLAGPDLEVGSVESVRRAAVVGGGKAYPIYAPMILPDAATVRALSGQPGIGQAVEQFDQVSIAVIAIGAWGSELSTVWQTVTRQARTAASKAGAVGEIGGRLFDAAGRPVQTPIEERVLGATLAQLSAIPEVVGLAYDERRAAAVHATLTGGIIDTLVCDASLGRALLGLPAGETARGVGT
ncbi:MAG: sugar-binding transcriptional regulator [Nocardioidaceae bacterium]